MNSHTNEIFYTQLKLPLKIFSLKIFISEWVNVDSITGSETSTKVYNHVNKRYQLVFIKYYMLNTLLNALYT